MVDFSEVRVAPVLCPVQPRPGTGRIFLIIPRDGPASVPVPVALDRARAMFPHPRVHPALVNDQSMFGWRGEVREMIAQLEQQRSRLEQVRERARHQGGREGERLEAQAAARLQEIEQRIADLRASLE